MVLSSDCVCAFSVVQHWNWSNNDKKSIFFVLATHHLLVIVSWCGVHWLATRIPTRAVCLCGHRTQSNVLCLCFAVRTTTRVSDACQLDVSDGLHYRAFAERLNFVQKQFGERSTELPWIIVENECRHKIRVENWKWNRMRRTASPTRATWYIVCQHVRHSIWNVNESGANTHHSFVKCERKAFGAEKEE